MKPHVKLDITAGTLAAMTTEQFVALRDNIAAEGRFDVATDTGKPITVSGGGDYIGIYLPGLFIGIEQDGYTHS